MHVDPDQWGIVALAVLMNLLVILTMLAYGGWKLWKKFGPKPKRPRARYLIPIHIQERMVQRAVFKRIRRGLVRLWQQYSGGWSKKMRGVKPDVLAYLARHTVTSGAGLPRHGTA